MKKSFITTISAIALGAVLPLTAQTTETVETDVRANPDGSVTETETVTTAFNPETRTRVVEYFDTHKAHPHGLPPGLAKRVVVAEAPTEWRTTRIEPGVVFEEAHRTHLVEAPPELVQVLPQREEVRYYIAGSNVVAVDRSYKVVDSIEVPSVTFSTVSE